MSAVPLDGGPPMWPPWARGAKRPSATSPDLELDGTCIPLADLRSSGSPASPPTSNGIPLVPAHPTPSLRQSSAPQDSGNPAVSFSTSPGENQPDTNRPRASSFSSSSPSSSSATASSSSPPPIPNTDDQTFGLGSDVGPPLGEEPAGDERRRLQFAPPIPNHPYTVSQPGETRGNRGPAVNPGEFMRGIAAEARAWSVRAIAGGSAGGFASGPVGVPARDDVDPVKMLLPDSAMGQRVGGSGGRGPLLRRLQRPVYGMLDDLMVVTVTRPGPLYVRLRPDTRGLVIVNNFDVVPDDPHTSCPRLGPVEGVGAVMPGDALVSVNREVLFGRPFSECVKHIRDCSSGATAANPCLLCFRKADPNHLEPKLGAPPRSLEQEKMRSLERLLEGGEGGLLDEAKLRGITSTGVPDMGGLRPILWRYLLRCLPTNRSEWSDHMETQRKLYARFVQDFILKPAEIVSSGGTGSRGDNPRFCSGAQATSAAREAAEAAIGGRGADAPRAEQVPPHRGSSDPDGSPGGDQPAPSVARGEGSSSVGGGADGVIRASNGSPERDHPAAEGAATQTTAETAAGVSSPDFSVSGRDAGGTRATRELRPADDDPLSNKDTSEWAALWSDKELMQAIEQDVVRTMPDLAFYACRGCEDDDDDIGRGSARSEQQRQGRERREAISRVLFVHAKLNPAESYTQGMNEIVATLYYVLATDGREDWSDHCEADTFFCFTNLMSEIRDVFIQSLDESESGLLGKMQAFSRTLHQHDPELADHMASLALDPRYYALRWFTTLLSREFDLPDTIRLWDSLFASQDRSEFLVFVFVTLMLGQREELLAGDFASNLQLLQSYPPTEVPEILAQSKALRLFSARGEAARSGGLNEQFAREASDGAKQAAEHVNAAARRFWNAATDLAAGAAEKMATMAEGEETFEVVFSGGGGGGGGDGGGGGVGGGGGGGSRDPSGGRGSSGEVGWGAVGGGEDGSSVGGVATGSDNCLGGDSRGDGGGGGGGCIDGGGGNDDACSE